jgi:hypothetical protein
MPAARHSAPRAVAIALIVASPWAAARAMSDSLRLVPTPRTAVRQTGSFAIGRRTVVALAAGASADDRFAAQQLVEEVATDLGIRLRTVEAASVPARDAIVVGRLGRDRIVNQALRPVRGRTVSQVRREGYVLSIRPEGMCIGGRDAAGTFYGVQTAKQMVRANANGRTVPCVTITDWPVMRYRGWQDDISRGPIPTLSSLKQQVRTLSEFKMNFFTMYTETVFRLKSHPSLAPPDGITAEEVRELCAYARKHHVEVAGNFASFGHANFLARPDYRHLGAFITREGLRKGDACGFNPAEERTYGFLSDVYDEIAPAYDSPLFMANCDEVFYLDGSGDRSGKPDPRLERMISDLGVGGVYARHINRLAELLARHGKTPMIWADSETVTAPPQWGTGPEKTAFGGNRDQALASMHNDVVLIAWEYEADYDFAGYLRPLVASGRRVLVAPGVYATAQIFPYFGFAAKNIADFTAEGARTGAIGMLLTTWDDDGDSLMGYQWQPLVWGAECSWSPPTYASAQTRDAVRGARLAAFRAAYPAVFYGLTGGAADAASIELSGLREDTLFKTAPRYTMSASYYWMGAGESAAEGRDDADVGRHAAEADRITAVLRRAKGLARHHAGSLDYVVLAARRCAFMARRIQAARLSASPGASAEAARAFEALEADAGDLRAEYIRLWGVENRPSSLANVVARYDKLIQEMHSRAEAPRSG